MDKEELSVVYYTIHLMFSDYFTNPLRGGFFLKLWDITMRRFSPFVLIEDKFSYKRKGRVGKQIPSKDIPLVTQ